MASDLSPLAGPLVARRTAVKTGLAGGLALGAGMGRAQAAAPSPRRSVRLDDGWRFHLGHAADVAQDFGFGLYQRTYAKEGASTALAAMPGFDDSGWAAVRVPHDWAVDLPYAPPAQVPKGAEDDAAGHGFRAIGREFPGNSVGWYRRVLPITPADKDRAVWLEFDGVFRDAIVFVNGYIVAREASGYAPFGVDIGDYLNDDETPNVLALRVDASLGEGWFYEGAGIYRHVTLVSAARVHVPQWGVCVRATPLAGGAARIEITTQVEGSGATLAQRIYAPDGALVATAGTSDPAATLMVPHAQLWSPETPLLYRLVTEVVAGGAVVDRVETPFGIRSIAFDGARGFLLNGVPVKLLGVCNHQDHAGVGTAIPDALHRWRVAQTQSMGANAWRSAHNPPAQAFLDACDAAGMMVIAEARLNASGPEATDELTRMILSSRNHPSVILWSLGNEEPQQTTARGARMTAAMAAHAHALDPTRPTTQAFDKGWGEGASNAVDVVGFNYRTDQIAAFHAAHPHVPVIGTEVASTVATRGAYANDPAHHVLRAYDTEHPWWAANAEQWWPIVADSPYIGGGFIWTGFDYRGEPTPFPSWPSVSSFFGAMDLCGFPKDNYWYYRAWWRPEPLVHLLPHWTWPGREGAEIEVWAYANCAEVELICNGRSLGRRANPRNGHVAWSVAYAPGVLEAVGYDRAGRVVGRDRRVTAGPAAGVRLSTDRVRIAADGDDLAVVRAEVIDARGNPCPTADTSLTFVLEGSARLLGTGNGDPNDHTPDHAPTRAAFNGLAQAIVQSAGTPGPITVTVQGVGLAPARLMLFAHAALPAI